jgi:hypothetical protein
VIDSTFSYLSQQVRQIVPWPDSGQGRSAGVQQLVSWSVCGIDFEIGQLGQTDNRTATAHAVRCSAKVQTRVLAHITHLRYNTAESTDRDSTVSADRDHTIRC